MGSDRVEEDMRDSDNRAGEQPDAGDPVVKALIDDLDVGFAELFGAYRGWCSRPRCGCAGGGRTPRI